jgi:hypothetical protein
MKPIVIRYDTKPGGAGPNAKLIEGVFRELDATKPDGVRYLVLRLEDGFFVHIVAYDGEEGGLTSLAAFKTFQQEAGEFRADAPIRRDAEVVGNYRMLAD